MNRPADRWIRRTTTGCVALLALIAGTVSYLHMHTLVELQGQPGWVAALTPMSVDGMIVAASTTLLADSRAGEPGGVLPWALLVIGSAASLAANVAVAQPTAVGRVIAAWPSFALIGAYELLMRMVRRNAAGKGRQQSRKPAPQVSRLRTGDAGIQRSRARQPRPGGSTPGPAGAAAGRESRRQAWHWALAHRANNGSLPSGRQIADQYGRQERWGRLVKRAGAAGEFSDHPGESALRLIRKSVPSRARASTRRSVSGAGFGVAGGQAAGSRVTLYPRASSWWTWARLRRSGLMRWS
jgi:hypothetical protein